MAQFTKKAIAESLIKMLNEKPLDKITVKAVVEDCGINRNTFYYHFEDIPTLVKCILDAETEKVLLGTDDIDSWEDGFIAAAQFALQNKKFVYHIYNSVRREEVERYLNNIAGEVMRRYVETASAGISVKEDDKKLIVDFYKQALVGMVREWLDSGMKYDPELLIRRVGVILKGNIEASLQKMEG